VVCAASMRVPKALHPTPTVETVMSLDPRVLWLVMHPA